MASESEVGFRVVQDRRDPRQRLDSFPMWRSIYTAIWILALPLALLRVGWRGLSQRPYWQGVGERLSLYRNPPAIDRPIWIHAVSVGETRAAQPLIEALLARSGQTRILLTQMTPTGRETAAELFRHHGDRVRLAYLPWDLPWFARRFLHHFSPTLGAVMETEVWPNLIFEARAMDIPMALVNARLSPRSAQGYGRLGTFGKAVFGAFDLVAAQTDADARRLLACGANAPEVTGNLKFDILPPPRQLDLAQTFRKWIGGRRTILAASTREGEEVPFMTAFMKQRHPGDLLILVPRHPHRFIEVAEQARSRGLRIALRSDNRMIDHAIDVLVGDSMGEMFAYYAAADIALIGGSWQPLGGQNLIESCAVGTPVVIGPHTFNFADVSRLALEAGAAVRAENEDDGMQTALDLLDRPLELTLMADAGLAFARAHRGATERTVHLLEGWIHPDQIAPGANICSHGSSSGA